MRTRKPTILDKMMNEVALYGGLPLRRCDILTLATEHLGKHAKKPFGVQYFAFHPSAVEMEPWPLEQARELMAS